VAALALLATALGVVTDRPGLFLVAVVGATLTAYSRASTAPEPTLAVTRTVDTDRPAAGESVTVTVAVENAGDRTLPDLRVADGVPTGLTVVDGTAQFATALRPGATARFEYAVRATRGDHTFDPMTGVARDLAGARERRVRVASSSPTRLVCSPRLRPVDPPALRALTTRHSGPRRTTVPGAGTEFVTVREYRRGDPPSRIDWRRHARTGELTTVEYAEQRSLRVLVLVDARESAYAAPDGEPTAVERGVTAAGGLFAGLLDAGHAAGLGALSAQSCWLPPGSGSHQRARGRLELTRNPAFDATPPPADVAPSRTADRLAARLGGDVQVVVLTPLVDDGAVTVARRLDVAGNRVTVLSPDATGSATPGERAARVERSGRIRTLRRRGVPVLDWSSGASLAGALVGSGWSR
jgi:uncharacterized repeat protein (TIGR01451 family)